MSSVSEITQHLRDIIEANADLQDVWIRGKILKVKPIRNGPLNFTLADENKKIECVIFDNVVSFRENLPAVGNSVSAKGYIFISGTISQYKFVVTDINLLGTTLLTQPVSVSALTDTLKTTLRIYKGSVQGIISKIFRTHANYTILKLKDETYEGQPDDIIECVFPPGINPPFPLQIGERVQVIGKFGTFSRTGAYRIEIDNANNITQVTEKLKKRKPALNQCKECHQHFSKLQDQLCHICYYANLTYEGIVVGAVLRYFKSPRFPNFATEREYEIRFGANIRGRADIALFKNGQKRPEAIAECKRIGDNNRNDGIEQLESYLNGSGAKLGLFADNTDPYEWTFLKRNDAKNRYDEISRSQFERELGVEPISEIPPDKTRFELIHGNIIETDVDAIVTTASAQLARVAGVDSKIREAAGKEIDNECQEIIEREGFRPQGNAVITTGGDLPVSKVIHAIGPIFAGGKNNEGEVLAECYKNSLRLAVENGIRSIAFPAISTGNFGFPIEKATPIALNTVKEFVEQAHQNDEMVPELIQFVLLDEEAYNCYVKELSNLGFGLSCLID